jgi:hypothetical protein
MYADRAMVIQSTSRTFVQGLATSGATLNLKDNLAETATDLGEYRACEDLYG